MFRLCFVIDTTGSMNVYLHALNSTLIEIIALSKLIGINEIGILTYKDYSEKEVTKWSGWKSTFHDLQEFAGNMTADGGEDYPEAARTAAYELAKVLDPDTKTIVMWFTDAPPHDTPSTFGTSKKEHLEAEKKYLGDNFEWEHLMSLLESKAIIYPIIYSRDCVTLSYFTSMASASGGLLFRIYGQVRRAIFRNRVGEKEFPPSSSTISQIVISILVCLTGESVEFPSTCNAYELQDKKPKMKESIEIAPIMKFDYDTRNCYDVFDFILEESNCPIVLTTNPIFGKYWRWICCQRKDLRRDQLVSKMSSMLNKDIMSKEDRENFESFLLESYKQLDVIHGIIEKLNSDEIYISDHNYDMKKILELSRSCNIKELGYILSQVSLSHVSPSHPTTFRFLPSDISSSDLFKCLPHLVVVGAMFSTRPACVLACIALYTDNAILSDKAKTFLLEMKGKWIDMALPEYYNYNFVKLVLSIPTILTESESLEFNKLLAIGKVLSNKSSAFCFNTGYASNKNKRIDYKFPCSQCKQYRSFTLLNKDGICGLCICDCEPLECDESDHFSMWYECRTCTGHYAVVHYNTLNVQPKCHFCRNSQVCNSYLKCVRCKNRFVTEYNLGMQAFVCPTCNADNDDHFDHHETTLQHFCYQNCRFSNVILKNAAEFFKANTIYKAKEFCAVALEAVEPYEYIWKNKTVTKIELSLKDFEKPTCSLCFEEFFPKDLVDVCGRGSRCRHKICRDCNKSWYNDLKPGSIISLSHLFCPFCKSRPTDKHLRQVNHLLSRLQITEHIQESMVYGWCKTCLEIKESHLRVCGEQVNHTNLEFKCSDCTCLRAIYKSCPGCQTMTEKLNGCNHIECTICKVHWCFQCEKAFDYDEIYKHMMEEHGTIGLDDLD